MSENAESKAHKWRYLWGWKGLLEVISLEVPAESVWTVAGERRWRQRIPDFRRCDGEAM